MIRLIAAIDRSQGIAKQGFQPWSIPEDERFFTEQTKTLGATILVGINTFKNNFHGPLADRKNYIVTHDESAIEGAELIHDLATFLTTFHDTDLWVVGGASVYQQIMELSLADELYLTHIDADFGCDQFFPSYDGFTMQEQSELHEENGFIFRFARYAKS